MVSIVSRAVLSKLNYWSHLEGSSADCRSTEVNENLLFRRVPGDVNIAGAGTTL